MSYHPDDTICAIGTAAGGAARGMVRVSGPAAVEVVTGLFQAEAGTVLDALSRPEAVNGCLKLNFRDASCAVDRSNPPPAPPYQGGEMLVPCDLFVWPTARSYTREPVAEMHTIGSPQLLQAIVAAVCSAGARLAEPGEFTLRAFLAGRIDLTQAEAVLGVIDAKGAGELDAALVQLAGGLARPLQQLCSELLQLLAELEAGLDFVDEDIRFISPAELQARLKAASEQLEAIANQMTTRQAGAHHPRIALVGPPNAGKSSLYNALVARFGMRGGAVHGRAASAALVSDIAGTTRDYITATVSFGGVACELVDTAGMQHEDLLGGAVGIELRAREFAVEQREQATIRAMCIPAKDFEGNAPEDCDLVVVTKGDLKADVSITADADRTAPTVVTSSVEGTGLDDLAAAVCELLSRGANGRCGQVVAATANRCGESIRLAATALRGAADATSQNAGDELVATELRVALGELGKVVGAVYTDDLLDRIFKTFCIGK